MAGGSCFFLPLVSRNFEEKSMRNTGNASNGWLQMIEDRAASIHGGEEMYTYSQRIPYCC